MKRAILYSFILLGLNSSCSKVLEKYPLDKPSQETFYNTASEIRAGVNACYLFLRDLETDMYSYPIAMDLLTDIGFPRQDGFFKRVAKGEHSSREGWFLEIWKRAYMGIARCNTMLSVIEEKNNLLTDAEKQQLRGETLFLRAFYYTRLVTYWGDVPLILKPIETIEEGREALRTPKEEVITQLMADYTEASALLPDEYTDVSDKGRATKGTAYSLKARAALYFGMFEEAASSANEVIKSGKYSLYPRYGDLFVTKGLRDPSNNEIILAADFSAEIERFTQIVLHLSSRNTGGWSTAVPSQNLVDSYLSTDGENISESALYNKAKPFENRDPRLKLSIVVPGEKFGDYSYNTHMDSTTTYRYSTNSFVTNDDSYAVNQFTSYTGYISRKYNDEDYLAKNTQVDIPLILARYAEVLLTYAEAKIELDEIDQSVVDAINLIRNSRQDVKMPTFTIASLGNKTEARKIIRHERKIELAFEGFRYTDLKRWALAEKYLNRPVMGRPVMGSYTEWPNVAFDENNEPVYDYDNYQPHPSTDYRLVENRYFQVGTHELWPIPQTERDLNPGLSQNNGY